MNGNDIEQLEKLFDAKLDPITKGVDELKGDMKKYSEELTELKTNFQHVGNCPAHRAEVEVVKREVDRISNRIWALVIAVIVTPLWAVGKYLIQGVKNG